MADDTTQLIYPPSALCSVPSDTTCCNASSFEDDGWDETLAEINLNIHPPPDKVVEPKSSGHTYKFKNVSIKFPYAAYKSQLQMMEKIIQGVTVSENCLLESPTGTGKTAALLCSLLAWQQDCYARHDNCRSIIQAAAERLGGCSCGLAKDENTKVTINYKEGRLFLRAFTVTEVPTTPSKSGSESSHSSPCAASPMKVCSPTPTSSPEPRPACPKTPQKSSLLLDATDFESPSKKQKLTSTKICEDERLAETVCAYCTRRFVFDGSRPPRIYYATRTHSQIAQVVKQLKCSAYRSVKMTILASREPTCINDKLQEEKNQAETMNTSQDNTIVKLTTSDICRQLRNNFNKIEKLKQEHPCEYELLLKEGKLPPVCQYFRPEPELRSLFTPFQNSGAWDLEDIKTEGKECSLCPYYGGYALHKNADIIFCSYNYLLHPSLRKATKIKIANSVIVFDEAHNIEDICRSAFSVNIDVKNLEKNVIRPVTGLIEKLGKNEAEASREKQDALNQLFQIFQSWDTCIKERGMAIKAPCNNNKLLDASESYENQHLLDVLQEMKMTSSAVANCIRLIDKINGQELKEEYYKDHNGQKRPFKVSTSVKEFMEELSQTLEYLCRQEKDGIGGVKDFKGYLTRTPNPKKTAPGAPVPNNRHSNQQRLVQPEPEFLFNFQIICLNPAIGFRALRDSAFSVIVASGTLTPLDSFASELCTKFAVTLQADHVIPAANVWAGVVTVGPSAQPLLLTKNQQDDPIIQDDIGSIIVQVCDTVPNGVLVFLPSYTLMQKLDLRFRMHPRGNSVYQRISRTKLIFWEKSYNKEVFKRNMQEYVEKVKGGPNWNGCILFAVFRGKISEGIDFADEQARAVITIGIPYSNAMAVEILSKKRYNDMRKANQKPGEQVLSGSEWYTTQAFRAMNQGFGRCVRHCNDWGALILIDSRLGQRRNEPFISGWVKKSLHVYQNFDEVRQKLAQFITDRQKQNGQRKSIQIEYEADLDATEIIPVCDDAFGEDDSFNELLTQIVQVPSPNSSVNERVHAAKHDQKSRELYNEDINTPDVSVVAESSPEYSFEEETQNMLELSPHPQNTAEVPDAGHENNRTSDSFLETSTTESRRTSTASNDSDLEMSRIADILQSPANMHNESDIMDVSMPTQSEHDFSPASSVSFVSD